jgi:small-conductance mechanosensitive channel
MLGPLLLFGFFVLASLERGAIAAAVGGGAAGDAALAVDRAIQVGLWLAAAGLLSRSLKVLVWERLVARALGRAVPRLLVDLTSVAVYVAAVTGIVAVVFGKSLIGFWATSSVVGLVLGFALRNMIQDLFTGVALNLDRPYGLGDWIEVHAGRGGGHVGRIAEINWRTTRLQTDEGNVLILPNGQLGTMSVTNFSAPTPSRRDELSVWLDFAIPPERAQRVLLAGAKAAVEQAGFSRDAQPQVLVAEIGELGVRYAVRYWYAVWQPLSPARARDAVARSLLDQLARAGITPAYPKEDVYHAPMPVRHLDSAAVEDREALLARVELLAPLTDEERRTLAGSLERRLVVAGAALIREGEPGESLFIVVEGRLDVHRGATPDGPGARVASVGPGQCVGEMSLLTGEPRSATLIAATDAVLYEVGKDAFADLIVRRPEIADAIGALVAARRSANQQRAQAVAGDAAAVAPDGLARQIVSRIRAFFRGAE